MMSRTSATWSIELTGWQVKRPKSWLSNRKTMVSCSLVSTQKIKGFTRMVDVLIRRMFTNSSISKIKHILSRMERMAHNSTNVAPWILFHRWLTHSALRSTIRLPHTALKLWCLNQRLEVRSTTITGDKACCNTVTPSCKMENSRRQKKTRQCSKKEMRTSKRCFSLTCRGKTLTTTLRQALWAVMISKACWAVFETRPITSRTISSRAATKPHQIKTTSSSKTTLDTSTMELSFTSQHSHTTCYLKTLTTMTKVHSMLKFYRLTWSPNRTLSRRVTSTT